MAGLLNRMFALSLIAYAVLVPVPAQAESEELANAYQHYLGLSNAGMFRLAIPYAERLVELGEQEYGPTSKTFGILLNNLATLYERVGRYQAAEPLRKRNLVITEKRLGWNDLGLGQSLSNLAYLYMSLGQYEKAELHWLRDLAIIEKKEGPESASLISTLHNLAAVNQKMARYKAAENYYLRDLSITKKRLAANHPSMAATLHNLAELYTEQGRYKEAEPLHKQSLRLIEIAVGPKDPRFAYSLEGVAEFYIKQGRIEEALILRKRALVILETAPGVSPDKVANSLVSLAVTYTYLHQYKNVEQHYKRALAIYEKTIGDNHPFFAIILGNLAAFYLEQGHTGTEVESLFNRALVIDRETYGNDHPQVAISLGGLAKLYTAQGRYKEAELHLKIAHQIIEKALGEDNPLVVINLAQQAIIHFKQENWKQAADLWRQSTSILTQRVASIGQSLTGRKKSDASQNSWQFVGLVKALIRQERKEDDVNKAFRTAQWAIASQAAKALAQMAVRAASNKGGLTAKIRKRQDKVREWQGLDQRLITAKSQPLAARDKINEKKDVTRLELLKKNIAQIDEQLKQEFPNYAALASPKPLSVIETQKLLKPDESLILLLDTQTASPTPAEIFIWAVTKDKVVWKRAELGGKELADKVTTLRCGIDDDAWRKAGGKKRCNKLTGGEYREHKLPFNLATAHELYSALFGQIEGELKGIKHLMVVPSGPLASLPLHLLVTEKPEHALPINQGLDYEGVPWLTRKYAITTLPSVSSLHALRGIKKKRGRAVNPLVGFGNPVLKGNKTCLATNATKGGRLTRRSGVQRGVSTFFRGKLANVDEVRKLCPLPGSAKELNAVASDLDAMSEIRLAEKATETTVKKLSQDEKLDDYRIVYFSTHGLLSGGLKGLAEPALVFTPPQKASEGDDGLLTASEVTLLKLNAEWVVMSACNTAGGDKPGGEALSGLARAFFYAGARALLVSHWPVYSTAATDLATDTFRRMRGNSEMGRATALQQSMLAFMSDQNFSFNSHPAFWAPFVVVGEGGADK